MTDSTKKGHYEDPGREDLHPEQCGYECVHCNLRRTDKIKIIDAELGLYEIETDHHPKDCDSCDKDYAVSRKRRPRAKRGME